MSAVDFHKKFNLGLTLEPNLREFEAFLKEYHPYIHSVYFSLPLGRKYHTRRIVSEQFLLPWKVKLFWRMLAMIREYGIGLEVLFNTLCLDREMIGRARDAMDRRGILPDYVCILGSYYDAAREFFPDTPLIWSFNNGMRTGADTEVPLHLAGVESFVLGSNFIRNNRFFAKLKGEGKQVILLLNNGCSFNCATCNNTSSVCASAFEENLKSRSVEYLYALQSIFPAELHEGVIDSSLVGLFKISNRGNSLAFARNAMRSYLDNEVRPYLLQDPKSYAYWGRAGYFWKYFSSMRLEEIVAWKEKILRRSLTIN